MIFGLSVCMSQVAKHVCMYVSNIHTYKLKQHAFFAKLSMMCASKPLSLWGVLQARQPTCLAKLTKTPLPVMVFAISSKLDLTWRRFIMYVCLKTLCLSWKTKHTRSNMNLRTQLRLKKIKENATPIEDSSCRIITNQRKRYPYRGIDVCIFVYVWTESKNPLPVRVFAFDHNATQPRPRFWGSPEFTPTRRLY